LRGTAACATHPKKAFIVLPSTIQSLHVSNFKSDSLCALTVAAIPAIAVRN